MAARRVPRDLRGWEQAGKESRLLQGRAQRRRRASSARRGEVKWVFEGSCTRSSQAERCGKVRQNTGLAAELLPSFD